MNPIILDLIVVLPFALVLALILWWAWRQETAGRFASTLDRRFAKDRPDAGRLASSLPDSKDWRNLVDSIRGLYNICDKLNDWREDLGQRVSALEEWTKETFPAYVNERLNTQEDRLHKLEAATPSTDSSPDTETQADSLSGSDTSSKSLSHVSLDGKPTPLVRRGTSDSRSSPRNLGSKRAPSRAAQTGRTPTVRE